MIQAQRLRKIYGATRVLDDVSLDLAAGQGLTLLGSNGAGKTTLLRILATLLRPTSGALLVAGVDPAREPERARAAIGMVGHGAWVYEDLTALENLRFWAVMGGQAAGAATLRAALVEAELGGSAGQRARTFSAGMKRRLALRSEERRVGEEWRCRGSAVRWNRK